MKKNGVRKTDNGKSALYSFRLPNVLVPAFDKIGRARARARQIKYIRTREVIYAMSAWLPADAQIVMQKKLGLK